VPRFTLNWGCTVRGRAEAPDGRFVAIGTARSLFRFRPDVRAKNIAAEPRLALESVGNRVDLDAAQQFLSQGLGLVRRGACLARVRR
jgi:hypothetical protein